MGLLDMQISEFVCQIIFLRYFVPLTIKLYDLWWIRSSAVLSTRNSLFDFCEPPEKETPVITKTLVDRKNIWTKPH